MKKIQIILLSLLVASSAFAWGKNERNALLGFGAGVIVSQLVNNHDNNYNTRVSYEQRIVHTRPRHVQKEARHVDERRYNEPRYDNRRYSERKHHKAHQHHYTKRHNKHHNKHHRKAHRRGHHNDTMVINNHRSNYYY
ncbi:MAG: hypothetical protein ACI9TV_003212 [Sulfurimonas sp.]|jgi:hypothetical protein|uniref:hypothetical protein n=1 Tax=Sulfurimonas sp. TaxID=2022749 RepID=UPI0039E315CC